MLAIVDYGMGNLRSVEKAFVQVGVAAQVTASPQNIKDAAGIVLPGVGAFAQARRNLERLGLVEVIREELRKGKPFLGICLGLQLLFTESEEVFQGDLQEAAGGSWPLRLPGSDEGASGMEGSMATAPGLGIIPGRVRRFPPGLKIPQIGWNQLEIRRPSPLLAGVPDGAFVYFVHSYYVDPQDPQVTATVTDYGLKFTSSIWQENIHAIQFHPEKSSRVGLTILRNFGKLVQAC